MLPTVLKVHVPLLGAVQRYHIDLPPPLPTWAGSPGSFVAAIFVPVTAPEVPLMTWAKAKLSLPGGVKATKEAALTAMPPGVVT